MPTIEIPGTQPGDTQQGGNQVVTPPVGTPTAQPVPPSTGGTTSTQSAPSIPTTGGTPASTVSQPPTERDPNKIPVNIKDQKTPLVILFGPPACGKTMALVRLTRYLRKEMEGTKYSVKPDDTFRPQNDARYQNLCTNFDDMISSPSAALSTGVVDYMLVKVLSNGTPFCQILEGPGELYFDPNQPNAEYPAYLNYIIGSKNRKVWVIMVEPESTSANMTNELRYEFVEKIKKLRRNIRRGDSVIILLNKIDKTDFYNDQGKVNGTVAKKDVMNTYINLFDTFKNNIPIYKWLKHYNCDFAIFQTGTFPKAEDGTITYQPGPEIYPKKLWELLEKRIKGL